MRFLSPSAVFCSFAVGLATVVWASPDPGLNVGIWKQLLNLRFGDAGDALQTAPAENREQQVALAIARINVQPVTESNLNSAAAILERVRSSSPRDGNTTAATYMLARLRQLHPTVPDEASAEALFEECIRSDPSHPLAQAAVAKLAILKLYSPASDGRRQELFDEFSRSADGLADPQAKRDLRLILATVAARFGLGENRSLIQLNSIPDADIAKRKTLSDVLIRRGELSLAAGEKDAARESFNRFLAEFPRDPRAYFVREQLKPLAIGSDAKADR